VELIRLSRAIQPWFAPGFSGRYVGVQPQQAKGSGIWRKAAGNPAETVVLLPGMEGSAGFFVTCRKREPKKSP